MGYLHIYCGDGKGKTTASIGLAIRAVGSGMKVLFVQFFKNKHSSEISVLESIDHITCLHAEQSFGLYKNMNPQQKMEAKKCYEALLTEAISKSLNYDMIILDEIISAYSYEMVNQQELTSFLTKNHHLEIILTGRNPENELVELADYVSEIHKVKHPYDKGKQARKGIEF